MGVSRKRKKRKVRRPSSLVVARERDPRESGCRGLLRLAMVDDDIILYLDVVLQGSQEQDMVVEHRASREIGHELLLLEQPTADPTRCSTPLPSAFGVSGSKTIYKRVLTDDISRNCSGLMAGGDTSSSSTTRPAIVHVIPKNTKHHKHRYLSHPSITPASSGVTESTS
jgi:hypothetical protein